MINNLPANAGGVSLIPESGISPGEGNAIHFSICAWKIPWTEEPGQLQCKGCKELDVTEHAHMTHELLINTPTSTSTNYPHTL